MLCLQKKNLLFILLIFQGSLSAGLKQLFFASLPRIILGAQVANYMVLPLAETISEYNDIKKNAHIYADADATKYVTNLLRDRDIIKPYETVLARWGNRYALHCGTIIEIPRKPESNKAIEKNGMPGMSIHHEYGHKHHQSFKKKLIITTPLYAVFWGLGVYVGRKAIFAPSHTLYESLGRTVCASYIPKSFMCFLGNPLIFAYSRHHERLADQFSIKYATKPEELEQCAEFYQKQHALHTILDKNTPPIAIKIKSLVSTHPSDLERAQYFQKAADALRAQQKASTPINND